jgi:hypothetical protein
VDAADEISNQNPGSFDGKISARRKSNVSMTPKNLNSYFDKLSLRI